MKLPKKKKSEIEEMDFKVWLWDESHALKSETSQRSIELIPLLQKMKRIVLISGTPVLARPSELFNLVKILRPDIFNSFKIFAKLYWDPKQKQIRMGKHIRTVTEYKGSTNSQELNYWLSKHIMIRRLKKDVLKELPEKLRIKLPVEVNSKFKKELENLMKLSEDYK